MSHDGDPEWRAAYAQLDAAVNELHRLIERDNAEPDDAPSVPTDYVLLVGWMLYDEDNDRVGGVNCFPKQGSQPDYITTGLVTTAQQTLGR
jgi:hypothetical protein